MSKVTYEILDENLNSFTDIEKYSDKDLNLINNFTINKKYDFDKHYIETHFYSINNVKLFSSYDYELSAKVNPDPSTEGKVSELEIDPVRVAIEYGFTRTDIKILFHFLNDLYASRGKKQDLFIHSISQDRTEVLLYSEKISLNKLINTTQELKAKLNSENYFDEYWLNLGENDLYIVTNVDTYELSDKIAIALKLYEPLPEKHNIKDVVQLVEKVSDSAAAKVLADITPDTPAVPMLRGANFSVDVEEIESEPTKYLSYNDLFSFENNNSNRELFSYIKDNSVDIGIDYTNYQNFINFSSAEERLKNFRYKIQLLENYQSDLDNEQALLNTSTTSTSGSIQATKNLIEGIINNFDHYEKHLYFESGSSSWPKSNNVKPYINSTSTSTDAINWYSQQLASASNYDVSNYDMLLNFLPEYIQDDTANNGGVLFTHMLGQHFDNLWIYTKALTDKYDNDNRLNVGISKDLVQEAVRSMGIKLYNSKESTNDLFRYIVSNTYDSGSQEEQIDVFVQPFSSVSYATASIEMQSGSYTADSNSTITITSGQGNTVTYLASNTSNSTGTIDSSTGYTLFYVGTASGTASLRRANLLQAILGATGHGGEIEIDTSITPSTSTAYLKQTAPGTVGNISWVVGSSIIGGSNIAVSQTGFGGGASTSYSPISHKDYEAEIYKRLYHNIPLLIKSKGTERGLKALINCFGIPSDYLTIKTFGGQARNTLPYFGPDATTTSSLGNIFSQSNEHSHDGFTLAKDVSIQKENSFSSNRSPRVEIGFSPSDAVDRYLQSLTNFNIDDYIGDPNDLHQAMYVDLNKKASLHLLSFDRFDLKDFVRIFKFYNNTIFKMVKDFVPARAALDAGIIIKPHLLNRSKAKSPLATGTRPEYTGSIDTAFITGLDGGAYDTNGELIVPRHLKHIEARWKPGKVGGASDLIFKPNYTSWNGTSIQADDGEIVVYGTKFYHPDGYLVDISERQTNGLLKTVATPYESASTGSFDYDFYIMYSSESLANRFPLISTFGQTWAHQHFACIDYKFTTDSWIVRGNSGVETAQFTPLPSDVIVAGMHQDGTTGISLPFHLYYKSLSEKLSGHITTIYSTDVKTISGSINKNIFDESPKLTGELSGSVLTLSTGELNRDNIFKRSNLPDVEYDILFIEQSGDDTGTEIALAPTPDGGYTTSGSACTFNSIYGTFYADTSTHPLPSGSTVYEDINLTTPVDGNNKWYKVNPGAGGEVPSYAVLLNAQGMVISSGLASSISGSISCTQFDTTAPSGYVADWTVASINNNNTGSVGFVILDGEAGGTYQATASDGTNEIYKTGNINNVNYGTFTNRCTTGSFSVGDTLDDGTITLIVKVADDAGNVGAASNDYLATYGSAAFGFYGDTITKTTVLPTGFSAAFKHHSGLFPDQTLNHNGYFRLRCSNLTAPDPNETYTLNVTLKNHTNNITKTVTSNYSSASLAFTGNTYVDVIVQENTESSSTILGTPSANGYFISGSMYITDSTGNQTPTVTDTVLYRKITAVFKQGSNLYTGNTSLPYLSTQISGLSLEFDNYSAGNTFPTYSMLEAGDLAASSLSNFTFFNGGENSFEVNVTTNTGNIRSFSYRPQTVIDGITYTVNTGLGLFATNTLLFFSQQSGTCIDPDTLILLSTGEEVKAEELTVGTRIKSLHETTLEEFDDIITRFERHKDVERVKVVFDGGDLICTPTHRLYLEDKGYFEPVSQIKVGDMLSHGKRVISIEPADIGDVIDITVDKNHTYISNGILSHNDKGNGFK